MTNGSSPRQIARDRDKDANAKEIEWGARDNSAPSISMFEGRPLSGPSPYAGPGFDRLARGMHQAISPPKAADEKTRPKGFQLRWAQPVGGDRVDGVGPLPVVDQP